MKATKNLKLHAVIAYSDDTGREVSRDLFATYRGAKRYALAEVARMETLREFIEAVEKDFWRTNYGTMVVRPVNIKVHP